jgi:hypothetical protein
MTQHPPPHRWDRRKARGVAPGPHQRALPSGLPPRASPWNPLVGCGKGGALRAGLGCRDRIGDRRCDPGSPVRPATPLPYRSQMNGFQRLAFGGGSRGAKPPWRGPGAEPLAFLRSRRRGGGACLRGVGSSARRRRLCDCDAVTPIGGAQFNGRTEEKDLAVAAWDASRSPGVAARGAYRMLQLRRVEAAAPCLQPLRLLRRARGRCGGQEDPEGHDSRLTPDRGARVDVV